MSDDISLIPQERIENLNETLSNVQPKLSSVNAGAGINITEEEGIVKISGTSSVAAWGNITGTLSNQTDLQNALDDKQDELVSGTNIKTINNVSILGSGNIDIQGGGSSYTAGTGIDITNDVISVEGVKDQRNTSTAIKTWTGTKAQYDALGNIYYNWITTETLYKWSGSGAVKDVYVKHSGALAWKETLYDETGTELTDTYEVGGDSTATTVSIYFPTQYYTYTYSGTIQSIKNSVYTKSVRNPLLSTTIYNSSLEESSLTITSVSTDSIILSDENTYNYNQSGNVGGSGYDNNTLYNITDDTDVSLTILEALYPVGSIYITTANTCPLSTLIAGSTWVQETSRVLVEKKEPTDSDSTWYNLYSDGWCEQGGSFSSSGTITLLKEYANNLYSITLGSITIWSINGITQRTGNSFSVDARGHDGTVQSANSLWQASGYTSTTTSHKQFRRTA